MNIRRRIAAIALLPLASLASGQEALQSMPPVHARASLFVADCAHRTLPSQAQVGEWTGQHNFSQVYDTRARLMADVARACQKPGIEQVRVVLQRRALAAAASARWVARAEPSAH